MKIKTAAYLGTACLLALGGTVLAVKEIQSNPPDPLQLLKAVAQARQQIASGEMEMEITSADFRYPAWGTNHFRLKAVFDGDKRRFESVDREYAYVFMGPEAAAAIDAKRLELGLDREGAVRAGLLTGFESRHVAAYDGTALFDYWANDGNPVS